MTVKERQKTLHRRRTVAVRGLKGSVHLYYSAKGLVLIKGLLSHL